MLKRFLLISAPVLVLLFTLACHRAVNGAQASAAPARPAQNRTLRFGSGGGFTGAITTYTLFADGRLERRNVRPGADTTQAPSLSTTVPAARAAACFQAFDALPADSVTLNAPGNMSSFIDGQTRAGRRQRLTWGAYGVPVPHAVRALYRDLTALVPRQ